MAEKRCENCVNEAAKAMDELEKAVLPLVCPKCGYLLGADCICIRNGPEDYDD